jgi:hypothetical protein
VQSGGVDGGRNGPIGGHDVAADEPHRLDANDAQNGDDICPNLSSLESQIAGLVTRGKVSTAQQTQLDSAIDSIRGELGCWPGSSHKV